MAELHCPLAETFSLTDGGPFDRLLVRLGQQGTGAQPGHPESRAAIRP